MSVRSEPSTRAIGAIGSLLSGIAAVCGSFLVVGQSDRFVGAAIGETLLEWFPDQVFAIGIPLLGGLARPLLLASATVGTALALGVLAWTAMAIGDRTSRYRIASAGTTLGLQLGAIGLVAADLWSGLVGGALGAIVIWWFTRPVNGTNTGDQSDTNSAAGSAWSRRRDILGSGAVIAGAAAAGWLLNSSGQSTENSESPSARARATIDDPVIDELLTQAKQQSFELSDAEPLVSEGFYQVDINLTGDPTITTDEWSLKIAGAVDSPTELSYKELLDNPVEHRFITLRCVSDELNGRYMDTALWTGTPIAPILDDAGVGDRCCVRLAAEDGYYHAFPRAALESGFLAWGMNGDLLPRAHGAPVRVLIPGHWGEINVKWLTDIEIREEPATGYWEERGWHGSGPVETVAKLHHKSRDGDQVTIGGHAYAGTRGISTVEVSTDGGETWVDTELTDPLPGIDGVEQARDAWRMWKYEYERADEHEVVVRAREADGTLQAETESEAFPSGATGWVRGTMYGRQG
ncbi:molybdopterin-dependent oxidoreductase [Halalkalirubrum salinum]|uniref:molybdopterin-dependent oxidoreductase n=1 Tax=Halalkalirubrum salinum TaxID=2563889 RepID=UPI0010FB570A|nr:molybdopterin-dependent oxidoreductase [Halalkalirubrum salinum]